MIYLDNNATTAVDPAVREAMLPYLTEWYGNPSSTHRFGQESRQAIERARHQVAGLLGCDARELIFTSGGTESDNAAIHGLLAMRSPRKTIITSSVEHSAVREPMLALAKAGYKVVEVAVDAKGQLDMEGVERALADGKSEGGAALVSIMWANNETGVCFDVRAIGEMCRAHGVPFHVDAVQAVGKIPMELRTLPIDLLSFSAHKFHGAKGVGGLYVRRGARWQPWVRGGPQERDRRGGTENVAGIVGMGVAAELAQRRLAEGKEWARVATLRDEFEARILERVADSYVNGDVAHRLPNTANIGFAGLEAEAILLLLSEQDICASAGAACSSGSLEPSHVLRAMHLPERIAHGAVRFSLSVRTTQDEIDQTVAIVPRVIERLRQTLPV
jgi:cysteine desulfurase